MALRDTDRQAAGQGEYVVTAKRERQRWAGGNTLITTRVPGKIGR